MNSTLKAWALSSGTCSLSRCQECESPAVDRTAGLSLIPGGLLRYLYSVLALAVFENPLSRPAELTAVNL